MEIQLPGPLLRESEGLCRPPSDTRVPASANRFASADRQAGLIGLYCCRPNLDARSVRCAPPRRRLLQSRFDPSSVYCFRCFFLRPPARLTDGAMDRPPARTMSPSAATPTASPTSSPPTSEASATARATPLPRIMRARWPIRCSGRGASGPVISVGANRMSTSPAMSWHARTARRTRADSASRRHRPRCGRWSSAMQTATTVISPRRPSTASPAGVEGSPGCGRSARSISHGAEGFLPRS